MPPTSAEAEDRGAKLPTVPGHWPFPAYPEDPRTVPALLQVLPSLAVSPAYAGPSTHGVARRSPACAVALRVASSVLSARDPTISREIADLPEILGLLRGFARARRPILPEAPRGVPSGSIDSLSFPL
jgi:hypothetical protein